jgi:hypothetical protein
MDNEPVRSIVGPEDSQPAYGEGGCVDSFFLVLLGGPPLGNVRAALLSTMIHHLRRERT